MQRQRKKKRNDSGVLDIALVTAIISLINSVITLITVLLR